MRDGDNHNVPYQDTSTAAFIDPRTLSKAVDAILPKQRAVASDSGHFCGWVPRFLRVPEARASCLSHSFQSVGLGLASAIGLAVANYLFLLLAYDWRTYAVLGVLSVIAYLFSRGPREHRARSSQRGTLERSPYEPTLHRTRRSDSARED